MRKFIFSFTFALIVLGTALGLAGSLTTPGGPLAKSVNGDESWKHQIARANALAPRLIGLSVNKAAAAAKSHGLELKLNGYYPGPSIITTEYCPCFVNSYAIRNVVVSKKRFQQFVNTLPVTVLTQDIIGRNEFMAKEQVTEMGMTMVVIDRTTHNIDGTTSRGLASVTQDKTGKRVLATVVDDVVTAAYAG